VPQFDKKFEIIVRLEKNERKNAKGKFIIGALKYLTKKKKKQFFKNLGRSLHPKKSFFTLNIKIHQALFSSTYIT
jgi:hypothetical protein